MKKMNLFIKSVLVVILLFWWSISLASAANFKMDLTRINMIDLEKISPIHFKDNNNDFWWFIYFSNWTGEWDDYEGVGYADTIVWENAEWESVRYNCKRKLKWFYYNSERWERLWPLDPDTWQTLKQGDDSLDMEWGLYTLCAKDWYDEQVAFCEDSAEEEGPDGDASECIAEAKAKFVADQGYFWAITHKYQWQTFALVAWVNYEKKSSWIEMNNEIASTFTRYDNKFPVWFIYDPNWWIGFVWCELTWSTSPAEVLEAVQNTWIVNLFEYASKTGIKLKEGINLWLNCENIWADWNSLIWLIIQWLIWMSRDTDVSILWNATDSKMQYFSSANINNATLMNYSRQRAENLCRGKRASTADLSNSIICVDSPEGGTLDATITEFKWKTIIVKNWNVKVSPAVSEDEQYYDIFIGSWNLIIDETNAKLFVFKKDWFISNSTPENFRNSINQEIVDANNEERNFEHAWDDVAVAALLKWNFIVNWWVKGASGKLSRKYFIHGKFTTKDTYEALGKVFRWRCVNWESNESNKNYCPYSQEHPYTNAFLVVIDQNYSSPLFR